MSDLLDDQSLEWPLRMQFPKTKEGFDLIQERLEPVIFTDFARGPFP